MKPRWTCRCTRAEGRIIKGIYGSTVDQGERWCSTSVWAVDAMDRNSFWDSSKVFCRPTVCGLRSDRRAAHGPCGVLAHARRQFFETVQLNPQDPVATPIVARMDELFAIDAEVRHRGLGLEARHVMRQEKAVPLLDVIRKQIEAARSIALPLVHWPRPATTRSRCGRNLRDSSITRSWSSALISRRTPCDRLRSAGRTGSTWAVHRPARRSQQSFPLWKLSAAEASRA